MERPPHWFWVGSRADVRARLVEALGTEPDARSCAEAAAGDVVVVDALATGRDCEGLPHGHVFSGVRALKERRGVAVYVVVAAADRIGVQLARFCLADGVLAWRPETGALDAGELQRGQGSRTRPSVDEMLAKLQAQVDAAGRGESTLQRLLRFEREDSLLHRLQDSETGLFDGPYATLKLDEEWKRSARFHLPLSLLLLDLGLDVARLGDVPRRSVLADAAGVFLNECRDIDVLARFAPSTFLFLLPGTGAEGAEVLARRMLAALRQRATPDLPIRPAAGLASVPSTGIADRRAFLAVAEACLRRAQARGGDGELGTSWE